MDILPGKASTLSGAAEAIAGARQVALNVLSGQKQQPKLKPARSVALSGGTFQFGNSLRCLA
jgi:hypothetical protein